MTGWIRRHVSTVRHALDEHPDNLMIQVFDAAGNSSAFVMDVADMEERDAVRLWPNFGTSPFRVVVLG